MKTLQLLQHKYVTKMMTAVITNYYSDKYEDTAVTKTQDYEKQERL